ncbi:MAG: cyclic beta 1-2 glucan synthetase [Acidobacteria bacterium]|nr:MAG: cyclic beta 1-2 glucan synthetase [Acidobacteriota bacterium]
MMLRYFTDWFHISDAPRKHSGDEPPLRSELFSADQMKEHGKALADSHKLSSEPAANPLLTRLAQNEHVLIRVHSLLTEAVSAGRRIAPAGEWLLDNFYLIEEQIHMARLHLPKGYSRGLPRLMNGESAGLPRVYDIARETISHGDGRLDIDGLGSFVESYQTVTSLTLGELWAIPTMLRLALIENLRRIGAGMATGTINRNRADHWADRITDVAARDPKSVIMAIADMTRSNSSLSSSFVAEFARRMQGQGSALALPLTWIEQRLAESGLTIKKLVQSENQQQAADQVSMSNSIGSLRFLGSTNWRDFVESWSAVEMVLREDPGETYSKMDFATRDRYRHVVERVAKHAHLSERTIACSAVGLAKRAAMQGDSADRTMHVGFYLIDKGLAQLERAAGVRRSAPEFLRTTLGKYPLALYVGSIGLLTSLLTAALLWIAFHGDLRDGTLLLLGVVSLLASSQFASAVVNWLATLLVAADSLPRMDFSDGIPAECRTLAVIPTMLTSIRNVEALVEALEVRFLGNRDDNLHFALLTDFRDAARETIPEDEPLLSLAKARIEELNEKYAQGKDNTFFLFHRPRRWNTKERVWMGYERKRGKLADLNSLLRTPGNNTDRFSLVVGQTEILSRVKYVITLDTDTELPRDAARRLVEAIAHPLNRARYDKARQRISEGYGILQPRVGVSLAGMNRSRYARMFGNEPGIDPYTRAVSDVYQDVFGEGSFIGKGIYDVDAFELSLQGRFPNNLILSHDLLEGCYARAALVSDVLLYEEYPPRYGADVSRRRRWIRGDWQIAQWLMPRVPGPAARRQTNPISLLSRWKILDNLRRSLVPAALTVLLVLGWAVLPPIWPWTLSVIAIILLPILLVVCVDFLRKPHEVRLGYHLRASASAAARRFEQVVFSIACLPYEALFSLGAIARTNLRIHVTHRGLLEWNPSNSSAGDVRTSILSLYGSMWIGPAIATALIIYLSLARLWSLVGAGPILGLWLLSPLWVAWLDRPIAVRASTLTVDNYIFLQGLSRKTWSFFETFVGPEDHWLPPDNFQENPSRVISHRTSPTNIGLALLSNLSAHDFGYISSGQLIQRTANTFRTMATLERYRGHFYNWYDTQSLRPLQPLYVSTVDSGNLAGHLLTLRSGLLELLDQPIIRPQLFEGIRHTLVVFLEFSGTTVDPRLSQLRTAIEAARYEPPATVAAALTCIGRLATITAEVAESFNPANETEASWWAGALARQCREAADDLTFLVPSNSGLDEIPTLRELSKAKTLELYRHANDRIAAIGRLAMQAGQFADMDYEFLFDKKSSLFRIGYNASEHRADSSYYDLLASEARLATFVAIAQGQAPQESWFALGRLLTNSGRDPVLLSWSGSMFEYLMPLLVMPTYEDTLLDQTCKAAVKKQVEYGNKRRVPWGISESGYNMIDVHLNYQYRAFGVPGLGFKRGLSDDLVITPYASALALMVQPEQACSNLQRIAAAGAAGKYGLYEALDYTPSRLPAGQSYAVVRSFMAHHQGMSLLSLANVLLDRPMQRRFKSDRLFQATLLLLQERIPRATRSYLHTAEFSGADARSNNRESQVRVFSSPNTPAPEVQLLSNGNYHVMITNAGGGYSRWKDVAVTRWREDTTRDNWGTFCYVHDVKSGEVWSTAHQPTLQRCDSYAAILSESRVEFHRRDNDIETHTEIAVSPEDDIELRRVRITNSSPERRVLDLTSYAEVVLASPAGDALHPAFGNLFVQTEILREEQTILCSRRPRSSEETPPWMFHLMVADGATIGEVSYETDRAKFIGRGRTTANPQAHSKALSGTDGSVLDPIVAIRCRIILDPEEVVSINIVTGIGETKSLCMELINKYQDPSFADRTFDLAWTHSQVLLRQINATEGDAQLYARLAGSVIYANSWLRAPESVLSKNRRNQSGLWGYTISGDLPIVLLRIADPTNFDLVRQLVKAHAYWRLKGLAVDLVIWNEDQAGYRQPLHDQIMALIAAGIEADTDDRRGRILVKLADHIAAEDRILLQAVARVIIADSDGSLVEQLSKVRLPVGIGAGAKREPDRAKPQEKKREPDRAKPQEKKREPDRATPEETKRDLIFFNGVGGFTADGREYVITTTRDDMTPVPWVNVIANHSFGTIVSESGGANTWSENAHEFRLTPWSNDPVSDSNGEAFYIRDEESGYFWSPTLLPCGGDTPYVARHGFGYSVFEHAEDGIRAELWVYVSIDASIKFAVIRLRNDSDRPRRLSVTGYIEWVLGDLRSKSMMYVATEINANTDAMFAHNPYSTEFADRVAFLAVGDVIDGASCTMCGDRAEFLGRNGTLSDPAAMSLSHLSGRVGAGLDPCAAIRVPFDLEDGQEREIVFTLGVGRSADEAHSLAHQFRGSGAARSALERVWDYWNRTLGAVHVETPDPSINVLVNGWLIYQTLACRFWARSGFYQPGGAFGFRDQLQDVMALIYSEPRLVREHLLLCAGHQFREGDVQHWWHPPSGRGVRTRCSDDYLWLPLAVCRYVTATGDTTVLDEPIHFIEGRGIKADEDSYYDLPVRSEATATLYDHCVRAILCGLRFGEHGLPLMGSGDWNDGMNLVGKHGKGESIWLGFFLYEVLLRFTDMAHMRGGSLFSQRCLNEATQLRKNIKQHGWDGEWYRRAYFDDGSALGSAINTECQIDSIAQSWSVLSRASDLERSRIAMEAVDKRLVRRDKMLVQLLDPPFDKSTLDPGYIKGYVPGVRENGGQYTHAAIWSAMAFAALGDGHRAWELLAMINPVNHGGSSEAIAAYRVEPYVVAADVYALPPHTGRGGWTWYTGSAGWMYRLIMESLLGLRLEVDKLYFAPHFPSTWDSFVVHYRCRETVYHIMVRCARHGQTATSVTLDGVMQHGTFVALVDDRTEHRVEVTCSPSLTE